MDISLDIADLFTGIMGFFSILISTLAAMPPVLILGLIALGAVSIWLRNK